MLWYHAPANDDSLKLNKAYPAHAVTVAWAQPNVVRVCETNFDGKVRSNAIGVGILVFKPCTQFEKALFRGFHWNSPLCCILWVLDTMREFSCGLSSLSEALTLQSTLRMR